MALDLMDVSTASKSMRLVTSRAPGRWRISCSASWAKVRCRASGSGFFWELHTLVDTGRFSPQ